MSMRAGHKDIFAILSAIMMSVVMADYCVYEMCTCDDGFVDCTSRGLTAIPPLGPPGVEPVTYIQFNGNQITSIPAGSLPAGLTQLTFNDNPIQTIDDDAFIDSASTLQTLALTLVPHSRIPDALLKLKSLTFFELYNTDVGDWNEEVMKYLAPKLQSISLGNVSVHTWPDWFQYCNQVTELTLDSSNITSIPDNGLDGMASSLMSLSLYNNNLTSVPKAISKLVNITDLYVDSNKITDLTWLPKNARLDTLGLSNNKISNGTHLSNALKPFGEFLSDLDLVGNELTAIPDLHFLTINGVELSFNKIYDLNAGSLQPALHGLTLGYNLLTSIPSVVFRVQSLRSLLMPSNLVTRVQASLIPATLTYLDLQHNLLTELADTSFPENSSLIYLYLNNNPLTTISEHAFANLVQLEELHLGGTRLTRLPLSLSSLHNLTTFDVSDITRLVCTCLEKDLGPWIKSLTAEKVLGTCGLMSVYDFFSLLSPGCPN
ncbi:unnamed protein product [Candidula unifasciata]|uniref:Uncharacterized protein n=1 Tax=Candidula unifasciata TaxID=100452 RepID=A0A8S3ZHQ7_9EUPU|nr:unnamed protein product [Candidula unifasciata]